jgi:MraZ protein
LLLAWLGPHVRVEIRPTQWLTVEESGVCWRAAEGTALRSRRQEVVVVFLGTHKPRLDEKNRVILPAKFREALGPGLVMTKGQDRCVVIYTAEGFAEYAAKLRSGSQTSEKVRAYTRVLFASAYDDAPDRQGRITIPSGLREYAGLTRDCVVVGADTRIEIWDAVAWETYLAANEQSFAELDGEVVPSA